MNGITINDKQYIFVISDEHCDGCALDRRSCEIIKRVGTLFITCQ